MKDDNQISDNSKYYTRVSLETCRPNGYGMHSLSAEFYENEEQAQIFYDKLNKLIDSHKTKEQDHDKIS